MCKRGVVKVIGLLGGMSWESSALYYQLVNQEVLERLGGTHSAECVMWSFDFHRVEALQAADDWSGAADLLGMTAQRLERAGAELLVLCTNTMHEVADEIGAAITIPLIHIADATADAIRSSGVERVALLGTRYTMERDFYRGRLESRHGLNVVVPDEPDRSEIHRIIYDELVRGIVADSSRQRYEGIIDSLVERGADGVILGCTEIELLVDPADDRWLLFPTTKLHALAAVSAALS
ncbi:MAG TPA: aspartate/glutamate racemase family protein [Ilumatobacteraceae bacterium]